jgi:hypothetical protein
MAYARRHSIHPGDRECPSANCAVKERRRQVSYEAATASFSGETEFR